MKVVFFCGDQSRYGIAHLIPLLESKFQISMQRHTDGKYSERLCKEKSIMNKKSF
jgi:hypothetical protein